MNKAELISAIAERSDLPKGSAERALNAFIEAITQQLKAGGLVALVGFGTFEVRERAAREGRNPQSGQPIQIEATKLPSFKPGKALKDAVN